MAHNDIPNDPTQWSSHSARRRSIEQRFEAKYAELTALPRPARRRLQRAAGASIAALAMSFAVAPIVPAGASATFTVTTTDDVLDADCALITDENIDSLGGDDLVSLREAICAANQTDGDDTIILPAGIITITLDATAGSEDLGDEDDFDILPNGTVTITGHADGTVIDGGGVDRVFDLHDGSDATFDTLTIQNGATEDGGGGINAGSASVTISDSLIQNNSAAWGGGAYLYLDATVTNTTFTGNSAGYGGGLNTSGTTFDHVTIVGNTADYGGGMSVSGAGVTISNSLIAGNTAANSPDFNFATTVTNSIIGSSELSDFTVNWISNPLGSDVIVATENAPTGPNLEGATHIPTPLADIVDSALADNGGPTQTLALPEGSLAIDHAAAGATTDQRGETRPDGDAPDAGAFEFISTPPDTVDPTADFAPAADALVIQGSTVALTLDCADDVELASCTATVNGDVIADGGALPTDAVGDLEITVTAVDAAGNDTVVTRIVTVLPKQTLLGDYFGASGTDGAVARLYMANFARQPDADGFDFWVSQIGSDWTLQEMASHFTLSDEFQATYGDLEDADFIELMYENVLGRSSDEAGKEYWLARLDDDLTRGDVLFFFSDSIEFRGLTGTS